jgi:beta-lactamase regulating signal transducer with metallopeptidase domain
MSFLLEHLLADRALTNALGWAILHSLWQGALVALALAACLGVLRHQSASLRYHVSLAALATSFGLFAGSFWYAYQPSLAEAAPAAGADDPLLAQLLQLGLWDQASLAALTWAECHTWADYSAWATQQFGLHVDWVATLWLVGVGLFLLRFASGLAYSHRLRRVGTSPVAPEWEARLLGIKARLGMSRPVRLLQSALVAVPTVVGWLRPVILFPVGMLAALPPHELESIVAHELAHIKRNDYLVNLLQSLVEVVLFYHPATWWISARIDEERENCCDDLAVATVGDAYTYIRALAGLAELRTRTQAPALAATGRSGQLLLRIKRIAKKTEPKNWMSLQNFPARLVAVLLVCSAWLLYATKSEATELVQVIGQNATELVAKVEEKIGQLVTTPADTTLPKPPAAPKEAKPGQKMMVVSIVNGKADTLMHDGMPGMPIIKWGSGPDDTLVSVMRHLAGDSAAIRFNLYLNGYKNGWHYFASDSLYIMNGDVRWRGLKQDSVPKMYNRQGYYFVLPEKPMGDWAPRQGGNIYYWGDSVRTWSRQFGPADGRRMGMNGTIFLGDSVRTWSQQFGPADGRQPERQKLLKELQEKMQELKDAKGKARDQKMEELERKMEELQKLGRLNPATSLPNLQGVQYSSVRQPNQSRTITVNVRGQGDHYDNNVTVNMGNQVTIVNRSSINIQKGDSTQLAEHPLYILDDEIVTEKAIGEIDPRDIKVVNVLRGKTATTRYGSQGTNGVIEITTKSAQPKPKPRTEIRVISGLGKKTDPRPLYVLDGQEVAEEVIRRLPVESIQTVSVLKGPDALTKYGEKGREGAVEVTTRGTASQPSNARTEEVAVETLRVYPNPVGERGMLSIVVELDKASQVSLQATDLQGRTVADILPPRTLEAGRNTIGWSTKGQSPGTYFINLALNGRVLTKRVVIE